MPEIANVTQFVFFTSNVNFGFQPTSTANIIFLRVVEQNTGSVPANISVSNITTNSNITFSVSGTYGEDIAVDDVYEVVSNSQSNTTITFTSFNSLNTSSYESLFVFSPDPFETKTMNIMFLANSSTILTYEQDVDPDHSRHTTRCIALIDRQSPNRG